MSRILPRLTWIVICTVLIISSTSCSDEDAADLSASVAVDGVSVEVFGSTNLLPGSRLSIWGWNHAESARAGVRILAGLPMTAMVNSNGSYSVQLAAGSWPPGMTTIVVAFYPGSGQPHHVIERYGQAGHNLRGPKVREDSDGTRILDVSVDLVIGD
jgi:hypothetical protein